MNQVAEIPADSFERAVKRSDKPVIVEFWIKSCGNCQSILKKKGTTGSMEARTMAENKEQEILAEIRTLLALERNYLAEERTELAEFRTGLALTVLAPAASAVIAYIFSFLQVGHALLFDALNFTFFAILTILGIWTSFRSRSKLNRIRKKKMILKDRECEVVRKSKAVHDLFRDCIALEDTKSKE